MKLKNLIKTFLCKLGFHCVDMRDDSSRYKKCHFCGIVFDIETGELK